MSADLPTPLAEDDERRAAEALATAAAAMLINSSPSDWPLPLVAALDSFCKTTGFVPFQMRIRAPICPLCGGTGLGPGPEGDSESV
jgi:hypothetical protein